MRFALAFHPDHVPFYLTGVYLRPLEIPEDRIEVAKSQGWMVLITDTEVFEAMRAPVPAQSNPRRYLDDENVSRDHGEA